MKNRITVLQLVCLSLILFSYQNCAQPFESNLTNLSSESLGTPNPSGDVTKPIADLTSPLAAATVMGTINLTATATDEVGVTRVQFYINNMAYGAELTAPPYTLTFNTLSLANAVHTVSVRAYDAAGNFGEDQAAVTLNNPPVPDTTKPLVNITSPANGVTLVGTVAVSATATDNVAVSYVQFYVDGVMNGAQDMVAPYSVSLNTALLTNGAHTISARAFDAAGNFGDATNVSITVNNPVVDTTAPTVAITSPVANSMVIGGVVVQATAADNVGVARVQFYLNGTAVGAADTSAPYTYQWDTTSIPNGVYVFAARAHDAAGNMTMSANVSYTVNNVVANPNAKYSYIAANILPKCTNCHGAATAYAGVRYDSYAETKKTVSSSPNNSLFYTEVNSGSMPLGGTKLNAADIEAIRAWISAGSLNN